MSHKANPRTQTNGQKIKAYFEANPGAHVPASSLAKALKMSPTICADAAGKMAVMGELHREKKPSGDNAKEVWIYSLPAPDTVTQPRAAKEFKPLKPATGFRRESPIEAAPSIIGPQAGVHASAQHQPQPEVGQNTGSLGSDRPLRSGALPEAQAVAQPPKPDETPVEAGGDVKQVAAPINPEYDPRRVGFNEGDRAVAIALCNHNLIAAICHATGFDDDQPTEALVDHVKALKERAEKAEADLESMASAARKFCAWVAEEFPTSQFPLNLYECQQTIQQSLELSDNHIVELTQKANEAQARADDLEAKAITLAQYRRILDEFHIESPAGLRRYLARREAQGEHLAATLASKTPEAYAVAAPKKPLKRFTARHSAEKAATAAARTVGSAEIYELHRIAKASRGAVVIREA